MGFRAFCSATVDAFKRGLKIHLFNEPLVDLLFYSVLFSFLVYMIFSRAERLIAFAIISRFDKTQEKSVADEESTVHITLYLDLYDGLRLNRT